MTKFTAKSFSIPKLKGISETTIEEHLKLYQGYVKNANLILEKLDEFAKAGDIYLKGELVRRFSFEYNGMRNHEVYFSTLQGGAVLPTKGSDLMKAIEGEWGSFDGWLESFKTLALTRGIGWAMLWYDRSDGQLLMSWVDEQHLGQLNDCAVIIGLDMWEHSYVADYKPSGKKQYIEDFFANLNWDVVENNYRHCRE